MNARKRAVSRRGFIVGASAAVTAAGIGRPAVAGAAPAVVHFQADGGISSSYLASQLAGHGQSIDNLAFITSASGGNLELLARGGAGTFLKLSYLDGRATERTGLAVSTGTSHPIISIASEASGGAALDLENNDLAGVETVVPSPDSQAQLKLDGLLALAPQARPSTPARGGVLYVDSAGGGLKFSGRSGTVTTVAPA